MAPTDPDDQTRAADRSDALAQHDADRPPTPDEERIADDQGDVDPDVAEHYREMNEIGAQVKGEGQIEP